MSKSLCVITPTIGRSTLERTLTSAVLKEGDEWLVISDGPNSGIKELCLLLSHNTGIPYNYIEHPKDNDHGNALRDFAMSVSGKDFFLFLDDDDIFTPDAIEIAHLHTEQTEAPIMFRMVTPQGETIWKDQIITPGNVGGSMFCVPNVFGKYGKWANGKGYASDFFFIEDTVKKYSNQIIWAGEIIVICQPERQKER